MTVGSIAPLHPQSNPSLRTSPSAVDTPRRQGAPGPGGTLRPQIVTAVVAVLAGILLLGCNSKLPTLPQISLPGSTTPPRVSNPGCDENTSGWQSWQGQVSRDTSSAVSGPASCKVTRTAGTEYTLYVEAPVVENPRKDSWYTAAAWVRSTTAIGKTVKLILRQRGDKGDIRNTESQPAKLTDSWQRVEVSALIDSDGRKTLEVYLVQLDAASGDSFEVDDLSVVAQPGSELPGAVLSARSPVSGTSSSVEEMNARTWNAPLFAADSPWNQAVPANSPADPNSSAMIGDLAKSLAKSALFIAQEENGPSLWYANSSTVKKWVEPDYRDWWGGFQTPIPAAARPSTGRDRHMVIWDIDARKLYEFWNTTAFTSGSWTAGMGITFDANGSGYQTRPNANSARAYGGSLIAGAIRYYEILDGKINHALAMAYPTTNGKRYAKGAGPGGVMAIATHSDNDSSPARQNDWNIPEGARLRLKQSVDVAARCGNSRSCRIVGEAMKTYGMYMVDTSPDSVIYAENLTGKDVSWNGLLAQRDLEFFKAEDFEVLALPPLTLYVP